MARQRSLPDFLAIRQLADGLERRDPEVLSRGRNLEGVW